MRVLTPDADKRIPRLKPQFASRKLTSCGVSRRQTLNEFIFDLLFCFACTRHQGTTVIAITLIIFVHSYIAIKFTIKPNNAIALERFFILTKFCA